MFPEFRSGSLVQFSFFSFLIAFPKAGNFSRTNKFYIHITVPLKYLYKPSRSKGGGRNTPFCSPSFRDAWGRCILRSGRAFSTRKPDRESQHGLQRQTLTGKFKSVVLEKYITMWPLLFQCLHRLRYSLAFFPRGINKGHCQACKSLCTDEESSFIYNLTLVANPILFPFCGLCFCNGCYVSHLDRLTWKSLGLKTTSTFELKILSYIQGL